MKKDNWNGIFNDKYFNHRKKLTKIEKILKDLSVPENKDEIRNLTNYLNEISRGLRLVFEPWDIYFDQIWYIHNIMFFFKENLPELEYLKLKKELNDILDYIHPLNIQIESKILDSDKLMTKSVELLIEKSPIKIVGHPREEFDSLYLKQEFMGTPIEQYKGSMFNHYDSIEWGFRSAEILKRDKDLCQICLVKCIKKAANTVAHRRSSWKYPEMWLHPTILYATCKACEKERHNR